MEDFFDSMDMGYTSTPAGSGTSQIDRILDRVPGIIDGWRRPPQPALTIPAAVPVPAARTSSNLIMILLVVALLWAVTK